MSFLHDPIVAGVVSSVIATIIITQWPSAKDWFIKRPWAVGGLAGVIAALFAVGLFRPEPVQLNPLPEGVVVASRVECDKLPPKDAWSEYTKATGRVIVGFGEATIEGTTRKFLFEENGGYWAHQLMVEEMPAHKHKILLNVPGNQTHVGGFLAQSVQQGPDGAGGVGWTSAAHWWGERPLPDQPIPVQHPEASTGGGEPHDNMPPYIALFFCKKEAG